jgi:hypothetical protein
VVPRLSAFLLALLVGGPAFAQGPVFGPQLPGSGPRLKLDHEKKAFKNAQVDQVYTDTVTVTNEGGSDLVISEIRPSCWCTKAHIDRTTIPPGGAASLTVTWNTSRFIGKKETWLDIFSNSEGGPAKFTVDGEVPAFPHPTIRIEGLAANNTWDIGLTRAGERPSTRITVHNDGDADLSISRAVNGTVDLRPEDLIPPKTSREVTVTLESVPAQRAFEIKIQLSNNDPIHFDAQLRAIGYLPDQPRPAGVGLPVYDFGIIEQGTPVEFTLKVRNPHGGPFEVEKIGGPVETPAGPRTGIALEVTSPSPVPPGEWFEIAGAIRPWIPPGTVAQGFYIWNVGRKFTSVPFYVWGYVKPPAAASAGGAAAPAASGAVSGGGEGAPAPGGSVPPGAGESPDAAPAAK